LGGPAELFLRDKHTGSGRAEVLVPHSSGRELRNDLGHTRRINGTSIKGGLPFNKNLQPGHELWHRAALGPEIDEC